MNLSSFHNKTSFLDYLRILAHFTTTIVFLTIYVMPRKFQLPVFVLNQQNVVIQLSPWFAWAAMLCRPLRVTDVGVLSTCVPKVRSPQ